MTRLDLSEQLLFRYDGSENIVLGETGITLESFVRVHDKGKITPPPTPENLWTRSLAEFLGDHETGPKRFTRIDDSAAGHIYDPNGDGWG